MKFYSIELSLIIHQTSDLISFIEKNNYFISNL